MTNLTLSNFFQKAIKGFTHWFEAIAEARLRRDGYFKTYEALSRLSDKELKDIGISRGEIHEISVRNAFNMPRK